MSNDPASVGATRAGSSKSRAAQVKHLLIASALAIVLTGCGLPAAAMSVPMTSAYRGIRKRRHYARDRARPTTSTRRRIRRRQQQSARRLAAVTRRARPRPLRR
jgi:hypothetical protein